MSDHTRLYHPVPRSRQWLPSCRICNDPVLLETSNTDEHGQAVHEDCYVLNLSLKAEFLIAGGSVPTPANRHATYQPCDTMEEDRHSPISRQLAVLATMLMQRAKHVSRHKQPWGVDLAAVVTVPQGLPPGEHRELNAETECQPCRPGARGRPLHFQNGILCRQSGAREPISAATRKLPLPTSSDASYFP